MSQGTPKTIEQAIRNGVDDWMNQPGSLEDYEELADIIKQHVQDFLAQKFGSAYLNQQITKVDLWNMIFPKER